MNSTALSDTARFEQLIERRTARRWAAEDRHLGRLDRLEAKADRHIGELCREGRTVFYISLPGVKYREANTRAELAQFLIRYGYVR